MVKVKLNLKLKAVEDTAKVQLYSPVVECSGRLQWQSVVVSVILSAPFKRLNGLLYAKNVCLKIQPLVIYVFVHVQPEYAAVQEYFMSLWLILKGQTEKYKLLYMCTLWLLNFCAVKKNKNNPNITNLLKETKLIKINQISTKLIMSK